MYCNNYDVPGTTNDWINIHKPPTTPPNAKKKPTNSHTRATGGYEDTKKREGERERERERREKRDMGGGEGEEGDKIILKS